jgi:hypothetical protein
MSQHEETSSNTQKLLPTLDEFEAPACLNTKTVVDLLLLLLIGMHLKTYLFQAGHFDKRIL